MSDELMQTPGDAHVPVTDAAALAVMRECGMTVALDEAQLRRLQLVMDAAVRSGDEAVQELRAIVGPEAAGIAQQLVRMLLMGSGYFRAATDTIHALFRAKVKVQRARKKRGAA